VSNVRPYLEMKSDIMSKIRRNIAFYIELNLLFLLYIGFPIILRVILFGVIIAC